MKALTIIDRILIIRKTDLPDKNKAGFLPSYYCIITTVWMHYMNPNVKKARRKLSKNARRCSEQILEATLHKTAAAGPLTSHLTNHTSKTKKACWPLLEKQGRTHKRRSEMDPYTWTY